MFIRFTVALLANLIVTSDSYHEWRGIHAPILEFKTEKEKKSGLYIMHRHYHPYSVIATPLGTVFVSRSTT